MDKPIIRVGIGVIVMNRAGQFLLGERANAHGQGTWAILGGHLDYGEDFADCAIRETKEEAGLDLIDVETIAVANHIFPSGKHYISIYCIGRIANTDETPQMDPREIARWMFHDDWNNLPQPLFVPYPQAVNADLIADYCAKYDLRRAA